MLCDNSKVFAPMRAAASAAQAHLRAELSDLPLQWARLWGAPETPGDLLLQGTLALSLQEQLSLEARLQRSRGRLLIASEGPGAAPLDAGIQTAQAELRIQGHDAQLQLQWDTEQAGQLHQCAPRAADIAQVPRAGRHRQQI